MSSWEREPVITDAKPGLANLLPQSDVEALIASLAAHDANWIQVVKDGVGITSARLRNGEGFIDLQTVRQAFDEGFTIQMSKMQVRVPGVGQICRAFEAACMESQIDLARPIGSHLYVTPPDSRGLLPHYDDHNVIVLQLHGTKHWRLFANGEKPMGRQSGGMKESDLPPLSHVIELQAGQILYVPRGCYHEAFTRNEPSTHLTLDIYSLTLLNILERAIRASRSLGHSLPVGEEAGRVAEQITPALKAAFDNLDLAQVIDDARSDFRKMLYALPDSVIRSRPTLTTRSKLIVRPGTWPRARAVGDHAFLDFVGGQLEGSGRAIGVFNFVVNHPSFTVAELPMTGERERLEFAGQLVDSGLLRIQTPDEQPAV